jgi:23S rRNA pseudouridine1911/1915/1917 synthase
MPIPTFEFVVESELSGIRVDSFLIKHLRNYNPWRMQRIARAGGVTINDAPAGQTDRVFAGQNIRVRLLEPPDKLLAPASIPIPILYEDPWLMSVNKPAGLISHPVGETQVNTLANALQQTLDERTCLPGLLRPGIVHRLDRQTSGAMVVALTHAAHAALSSAFEASRVAKTYLALVEGRLAKDEGTISLPIGRAPTGRHVLMSCRADAIERRPARTHYEVVLRFSQHTLLLARPRTGRNHQIRVHLAALGHPLVGDEFYLRDGKFKDFRDPADAESSVGIETGLPIRRHALHAIRLELAHPITGRWLQFSAPVADDLRETIRVLGSTG